MDIFKFGKKNKKTVKFINKNTINISSTWYGKADIDVREIEKIFIKNASSAEDGTVYISVDGNNPYEEPEGNTHGFKFTHMQDYTLSEFLKKLKMINENITIERSDAGAPIKKDNPNIAVCPSCKSKNVEFLENTRKSFSAGKAVSGALLVGGVGAFAGFIGKKGKDRWHCEDCGTIFEK